MCGVMVAGISILLDILDETTETFTLELETPPKATISDVVAVSPNTAQISILDDHGKELYVPMVKCLYGH